MGHRVAFVAAFVLLLQSFLTAWAMGAMPIQTVDAFGNPICITGSDIAGKAPSGDHSSMHDCCALGCSQASTVLEPPPATVVAILHTLSQSDPLSAHADPILVEDADHDPGSPRAPPLTV